MSLFGRIFVLNAVVIVAAATLLIVSPVTVSTEAQLAETLIVGGGLLVTLIANAVLVRIGLSPVKRLTKAMTDTDLLQPGPRPRATGKGELADVIRAFNSMLDRLEAERGHSAARALTAQESERRRIAQELHDEVGQTLTAVLLQLKSVADQAPDEIARQLLQVKETTRASLDEIRRIARRLRPGVLEELGLVSALKSLVTEASEHTELTAQQHCDANLPDLGDERELVIYRVAQEGITNVVRHAQATRLELRLRTAPERTTLLIRDNGRGRGGAPEGAGIRGMRERALLIGAQLTIGPAPERGTEVRLDIPTARQG